MEVLIISRWSIIVSLIVVHINHMPCILIKHFLSFSVTNSIAVWLNVTIFLHLWGSFEVNRITTSSSSSSLSSSGSIISFTLQTFPHIIFWSEKCLRSDPCVDMPHPIQDLWHVLFNFCYVLWTYSQGFSFLFPRFLKKKNYETYYRSARGKLLTS